MIQFRHLIVAVSLSLCLFAGCQTKESGPISPPVNHTEVFPLAIGAVFEYGFYESTWDLSIMTGGLITIDTGTVSYVIQKVAGQDGPSTRWLVGETAHLHRRHAYKSSGGDYYFPPDTSYWIDSVRTDTLTENGTGDHSLSARFRVWSFPIVDSAGNAGLGFTTKTIEISRYAPASTSNLANAVEHDPYLTVDTLQLQEGKGLTFRRMHAFAGINVYRDHQINITLRSVTAPATASPASLRPGYR